MPSNQQPRLPHLVKELRRQGFEFFVDAKKSPRVKFPNETGDYPAGHVRIADTLRVIAYETRSEMLAKSEVEFLLAVIRTECHRGGQRICDTNIKAAEASATFQAVLRFFTCRDQWEGRTTDFREELTRAQGDEAVPCYLPVFTNVFSRELNRHRDALRHYGIEVQFTRRQDGSHIKLTRLPGFNGDGPAVRSDVGPVVTPGDGRLTVEQQGHAVPNLQSSKDLERADGCDVSKEELVNV